MTSGDKDRSTETAEPAGSAFLAAASAEEETPAAEGDRVTSFAPSYPGTTYAPPSSYSGSEWSTSTASEWSASTGPDSTVTAPVHSASPGPAPADDAGAASPPKNGYPSGNGFSSGAAASAAGGTAAGPASSVTSAWQKRGSARNISASGTQARRSPKRQAMLTLARVEPWSVMKFSFVASVVAFIILFVAVALLYMVLSALGVFDSLQHTISSVTGSQNSAGTNISHYYSASIVLGYTAMLGALNIVLITAISTIGSVIYNLIAKTVGGIEVTLRETD